MEQNSENAANNGSRADSTGADLPQLPPSSRPRCHPADASDDVDGEGRGIEAARGKPTSAEDGDAPSIPPPETAPVVETEPDEEAAICNAVEIAPGWWKRHKMCIVAGLVTILLALAVAVADGVAPSVLPSFSPSWFATLGGDKDGVEGDVFDGLETGDFSALKWSVSGDRGWSVDETKPYRGRYSAHVRTEDILASRGHSQLNLEVDLASATFVQFYFHAPVAPPFDAFDLMVDGRHLRGLFTEDGAWAEGGTILPRGRHVVSWRLAKNPSRAPDDALEELDPSTHRRGEAWLDDVALIGATPSFLETWESGDLAARPWMLSGDGDWRINDATAYEGTASATVAQADIAADAGVGELSIDIITQQGGKLKFFILPSVAAPFDVGNVLLDDAVINTYSSPVADWQAQELDIQPGKRKVTFRFVKNPENRNATSLASVPSPHGRRGQIWLDRIEFVAAAATAL